MRCNRNQYLYNTLVVNVEEPVERERLIDPWWRKARIGARLLHKKEEGRTWTVRDRRLAAMLANDPGVTNRLLDQAWRSLLARKKYGPGLMGWFR
jgi:hypothetical protein